MENKLMYAINIFILISITTSQDQNSITINNLEKKKYLSSNSSKLTKVLLEICPRKENNKSAIEISAVINKSFPNLSIIQFCNFVEVFDYLKPESALNETSLIISYSPINQKQNVKVLNLNDRLLLYQEDNNFAVTFILHFVSKFPWKHVYFYVDKYYGKQISQLKNWNPNFLIECIVFVENITPEKFISILKLKKALHHRLIVVLTTTSIASQLIQLAEKKGFLNRIYHWLVFINTDFSPKIQLRMDTNIYIARHAGPITNITSLTKRYLKTYLGSSLSNTMALLIKIKIVKLEMGENNGSISYFPISTWTVTDGLQLISPQFTTKRPNYHKKILRAIAYETPPYVLIYKNLQDNTTTYKGYFIEVLELVAKHLNFTVHYIHAVDAIPGLSGGSMIQNMIQYVHTKKADIALLDFSLNLERLTKMDYARVALDTYSVVGVFQRPDPKTIAIQKIGGYYEPLEHTAWFASIGAVLLLVITFHWTIRINKRLKEDSGHDWPHENATVSKTALLVVRTFAAQGTEDNVEGSASARIIFIFLWIFALLFATAYNATLMSHLTVNKVHWPFKTLEELNLNKDFQIGFRIGSGSYHMFKNSTYSAGQQIFRRSQNVEDFDDGLQRAAKGKYVFMVGGKATEYLTRDSCVLAYSNSLTLDDFVTITFQKDSPHSYWISRAFRALNDGGILYRLRQKWWERTKTCKQEENSYISFTLRNVAPAFAILFFGLVCSLISMFIEHWLSYSKYKRKTVHLHQTTSFRSHLNDKYNYFYYS